MNVPVPGPIPGSTNLANDHQLKICFILSSIGGPRMLSPLLSGHVKEDIAYVVVQRSAGAGLLDVLVECLREELNRKTVVAGHSLELQPGAVHFLPNERNYSLVGNKLVSAELPASARLSLDLLFTSAAASRNQCAVVVLSGMFTDEDGLQGLEKLKAAGAPIVGTLESHTPVFDWIDQLRGRGLMGELYPLKNLLEHLRFTNGEGHMGTSPGPIRYLVADDEEKIRTVIVEMLRLRGIDADSAVDGLDALRKIQKGRYDLLILDLNMPEMDGLKTLEALKTIDPHLPIVVLTGLDDPDKFRAVNGFKVMGILTKPFTFDKLQKILSAHPASPANGGPAGAAPGAAAPSKSAPK